ncbi:MAG: pitrilysin family protein [Bacteroidota bacterium]
MTRFFSLLLLLILVGTGSVQAQQHYSDLDFPDLPDFQIPEAERVELDNGLVVFLIEDRTLPLVSMSARVGVGSVYESPDQAGLAGITGSAMRTGGTTSVSGDELNARLESIGAAIETSIGETAGSAFMSTLTEHVDTVLPLFVDVLVNPAFPEDKVELAKNQQKSGIARRNDDAQQIAFREFDALIYGEESPYARTPEYFTVDAISRDDVVAFHEAFFHPNNVILGVWGDFDTEAMAATLRAAFADWPANPSFAAPAMPEVNTESDYGVYYAPKMDVNQSTVLLGHPGEVRLDDPDYHALTVMNEVLSGFSGRLFQNVRKDQGLAYAVFGGYTANYNRPGLFYSGVITKSESTVEAAQSVQTEIEKLRAAPPTEDELSLAKDSYLNSFVFNFDTRSEIVGRMMTYEYYGYPTDFLEQRKNGVEAVTAADVQRVAAQYLRTDDLKILAVGNGDEFGEPMATLGDVTTLDISIPTTQVQAPEATAETLSQGQALLNEAIAALGGQEAFEAIETIRVRGSQTVNMPDNMQMSLTVESIRAFPDRMRMVQEAPMGNMALLQNGSTIMMQAPQGSMEAPPPVRQQVQENLWRDLPYLFRNANRVQVQYLGADEINGTAVESLQITAPASGYTLYLDAETKRPVAMDYQAMSITTGAIQQGRDLHEDYRELGQVMLPFRTVTFADGTESVVTQIETIELNIDVSDVDFGE